MGFLNKKLRIIFVGIPDMATVCLSNLLIKKFNIVGVVPPRKTHDTYNFFKSFVLNKGLNLIEFNESANDVECVNKIKALNADIGVVCSYNDKLSKEFLATTKMGYINSHPSKLPQYRGAMPYFHIVNNGEKKSGITLHFMDETFDTGDIVYQNEFDIMSCETMGTLFNRTTYMISDALIEILTKLENGEKLNVIPQQKQENLIKAPYVAGNFRINWKYDDIFKIERLVRATNPFFQAYSLFRGVTFQIIKCRIEKAEHNFEVGRFIKATKDKLVVAAKDGFVYLDIFQVGSWGIFNTSEFYQIFSPREDEFLI